MRLNRLAWLLCFAFSTWILVFCLEKFPGGNFGKTIRTKYMSYNERINPLGNNRRFATAMTGPLTLFIFQPKGITMGTIFVVEKRRKYGCLAFIGDCLMTLVTGGLWLIWIFIREMRRR